MIRHNDPTEASYTRLSILTGSRFVHITASFVQRFTALGEQMRIYTEPQAFESALRAAAASASASALASTLASELAARLS